MSKSPAFLDEPTDLSLVQGGPLFQLFVRARLWRPPTDLLARRIIVISAILWLPLLLLTVLSGHAVGGVGVPFVYDWGAQIRFLVCVPLLISAEVIAHQQIKMTVRQFSDRGLVAPEDQSRFEKLIASAMHVRNSVLAESILLAFSITGGYWIGERYVSMQMATWYAFPIGDQSQLTMAGYWYLFVSLTILRFLLFRWYFRLFIWYRFLWQVSRQIRLRLNSLHPDRAGGLAFLSLSVFAFAPVLLSHTIGLAGILGGKIHYDGATLPQFRLEIIAWMLFLLLLVLVPLCFFMIQLADAKRTGLREYGVVASRYVADFRRKWIDGQADKDEGLIGSADIQSLADLSNSFDVVRDMRLVPFSRTMVLQLALLLSVPLAPLTLTMIPLEELIDRALSIMF
jgi:hypothetical protein